ncbi:MAG: serine/threonine protein kinase [Lachnospiraceae bacterium]
MTLEEHYRISFYQPAAELGGRQHVVLTRHTENGTYYVRKKLKDYNRKVYDQLRVLDSDYFPHIYELVEEENHLLIIEEYIQGETLEEHMQRTGPLTIEQLKPVMLDVCQALCLLHGQTPPIIHRDIKPSNLILASDGHWKLIDFNTARYYEAGAQRDTTFLGTREFAAPEQFGDLQTDVRTDIYELGAMMNYLLTGQNHKKYMHQGTAENIIRKCTQFDPARRYQHVETLMHDIQKLSERPVSKSAGQQPQATGWRFWLPPGFRTLKTWKMITAGIVYVFTIWICLSLEVTSSTGEAVTKAMLIANRGGSLLLFLAWILLWFNYGGIQRYLPLIRKPQIGWKIAGYVVWSFVIFIVIMIGVMILSNM